MTREGTGSSPVSRSKMEEKLYVVTRADLPIGLRCAQVGHALLEYAQAACHWDGEEWHLYPIHKNLVVLQVADLAELEALQSALICPTVSFREPDLGDQLTAIAVSGHHEVRACLSSLPLLR